MTTIGLCASLLQAAAVLALAACGRVASRRAGEPRPSGRSRSTEVATSRRPWAMDFLPGSGVPLTNIALVTEKGGQAVAGRRRNGARTAVAGVPSVKVAGQGGLGDVVAASRLRRQPAHLSELRRGRAKAGPAARCSAMGADLGQRRAAASRASRSSGGKRPRSPATAISRTASPSGPTACSTCPRASGRRSSPAQDFGGNLGKMLRLTAEGQPAPGNPWAARAGSRPNSGRWATATCSASPSLRTGGCGRREMGPQGGDEINLDRRRQELRLAARL